MGRKRELTLEEEIQELERRFDELRKTWGIISVAEAQKIRGVTRQAILSLLERGRVNGFKAFGKVWVFRSDIEEFRYDKPGPKSQPEYLGESGNEASGDED